MSAADPGSSNVVRKSAWEFWEFRAGTLYTNAQLVDPVLIERGLKLMGFNDGNRKRIIAEDFLMTNSKHL